MTTASEAFTEAFRNNDTEESRSDALESSSSYDGDGQGEDELNNSNSDLDLIEGDGIGGDNSRESNQQATEDFADEVANGKDAVSATGDPVNSVLNSDGDAVAVAASEDEIREAGAQLASEADSGPVNVPEPNAGPSTTSSSGPSLPTLDDIKFWEDSGSGPTSSSTVSGAAVAGVVAVALVLVGLFGGGE